MLSSTIFQGKFNYKVKNRAWPQCKLGEVKTARFELTHNKNNNF